MNNQDQSPQGDKLSQIVKSAFDERHSVPLETGVTLEEFYKAFKQYERQKLEWEGIIHSLMETLQTVLDGLSTAPCQWKKLFGEDFFDRVNPDWPSVESEDVSERIYDELCYMILKQGQFFDGEKVGGAINRTIGSLPADPK